MSEVARILDIPVKGPETCDLVRKWTDLLGIEGAPDLRYKQAECFEELASAHRWCGGLFGLDVGAGKTLTGMLAPKVLGCEGQAILLTKSSLVKQTRKHNDQWSKIFPCEPPTVVSYSMLSTPKGQRMLHDLQPKLIICDEAHCLANHQAARTKRLMAYAKQYVTQCRFVYMSGSFVKKSVRDFAHLSDTALLAGSPLPPRYSDLANWAAVLDWGSEPTRAQVKAFAPMREWAGVPSPRSTSAAQVATRIAFRKRLWATPGVVWSSDSSCDTELTIRPWTCPLTPRTKAALEALHGMWELPNGDCLVSGSETYRHAHTLAYGFYQVWDWDAVGGVDVEWNEARKAWTRAVNGHCTYRATPGMDTRYFVEEAARRGDLPAGLQAAWAAWLAVSKRPAPPTKTVVHDPLQVRVLKAMLAKLPADTLIWIETPELAKLLPHLTYHGVGTDGPEKGTVLISSKVHGTGWDGWHYRQSVVLQPGTGVDWWQQLLGRTHRGGQTFDVGYGVAQNTQAQKSNLAKARSKATTSEDLLGQQQKLCSATWAGC